MKTKYLIFLSAVFVLFLGTFIFFNPEKGRPAVIPAETNAADLIKEFDYALKMALFNYYIQENEEAGQMLVRAQKAGGKLAANNKERKEFAATRDWEKKWIKILEHINNAQVDAGKNDFNGVDQDLALAQAIYKKIKEENRRPDISGLLLDLYGEVAAIGDKETKAETAPILPDLKYKFTGLKQFSFDDRYIGLIAEMESHIAGLDRLLDGPDFKRAQKELKTVFMELYLNY